MLHAVPKLKKWIDRSMHGRQPSLTRCTAATQMYMAVDYVYTMWCLAVYYYVLINLWMPAADEMRCWLLLAQCPRFEIRHSRGPQLGRVAETRRRSSTVSVLVQSWSNRCCQTLSSHFFILVVPTTHSAAPFPTLPFPTALVSKSDAVAPLSYS